ncbi:hypothetical protein SAMN05216297_1029 [Flavobacterium phragmitis]|uniref:Uncharacterized protein n=1 Tax=Flavobacterium phragmitis TaxID=739143 RepID=A0A1I1LHY5_9FLAO|nr:hypothetical protein SAMN05216297_1029 [Flavobacterium phragmitis]
MIHSFFFVFVFYFIDNQVFVRLFVIGLVPKLAM